MCLPRARESFPAGSSCWVTGWGYTREGGEIVFLKCLRHPEGTFIHSDSLWFSHRACVVTPETGFSSGDRSGRLLTALRVRLPANSQNALRWRYEGRSGLLSGIHIN